MIDDRDLGFFTVGSESSLDQATALPEGLTASLHAASTSAHLEIIPHPHIHPAELAGLANHAPCGGLSLRDCQPQIRGRSAASTVRAHTIYTQQ